MDLSDEMDKSWDHPWTTEEMRKKRREWSLAGDAGLLKHLQAFSENLVSRTNKTQEALDGLTTQLSEAAILINNVTNTSLALANTQFIESRVQDDDVEMEKKTEVSAQEPKDQDWVTADLIASVSESVRQGLDIMDEKYRQMEVVDSDSEGEDDAIVLSVILGPNNPYQDRPLPYVIGSDKWINSNKIGLESSSSESEQIDEEDEESESDKEDAVAHRVFDMKTVPKVNIARISCSSSESDNYTQKNNVAYINNDKMDAESQNNINSFLESPVDNVSKAPSSNEATPNFAEELAKRLGTVRQAQKPVNVDEANEASINRLKDDLFTPEEDDSVPGGKTENILVGKGLFNDKSSVNLWKEKPIKPYKHNIIPASVDVPPPISTVSTKPKSAIDDLFADADSEDSDDIFSSKSTIRKTSKDAPLANAADVASTESIPKKHLNLPASAINSNMATSTPEMNTNASNLFSDEEDVGDLFGAPKDQSDKSGDISTPNRKKPVGGVSILGNILASDIESKASSRIPRAQSSGSSGSDTPANHESSKRSETPSDSTRNTVLNDNIGERSSILGPRNNAENLAATIESSYSSGISIHPPSINNTSSSIGVDFQPQMTSTRLKSEEIYRERVASDSLFTARTRNPATASTNSTTNQTREEQAEEVSSTLQDDVFENEDLFGPPPLPKSDSKLPKSKVSSLFDDSDSGDELFSTTSSGSRSQKSTDFLATTPQNPEKSKPTYRKGIFDEDIDIFGAKDSPDVDIFGIATKSTAAKEGSNSSARKPPEISTGSSFASNSRDPVMPKDNDAAKAQQAKPAPKKISLFDDDDDDDGDLFGTKPIKTDFRVESHIFQDDEENDLFSSEKVDAVKQSSEKNSGLDAISDNAPNRKTERKTSDILSGNGLFSNAISSHGLIFEDDDYDDLFGEKSTSTKTKVQDAKSVKKDEETRKMEEPCVKSTEPRNESQTSIFQSSTAGALQKPDATSKSVSHIEKEIKDEEAKAASGKAVDAEEDTKSESRRSPPKTLDIRADVSSPPPDDNEKGQRRAVSGKIKNLMGKVGDLKILSPMDTPPLWRRSDEKTDEEDSAADRDSDDGGCLSIPSHSTPPSISESSITRKQSLPSTASGGSNIETAISFDEPAQVETLSTAASKTRVRIQAKRRPQSRHARKSALRQSGIDFDTVDAAESNLPNEGRDSDGAVTSSKESANPANTNASLPTADRLSVSTSDNLHRLADSNMSLAADDKSELGSLSKESSMSANKNTLLSPSTDEEDLFDVPPDLPEDPQKEDTLFGRAPILSPVDKVLCEKIPANFKPLRDTHISRIADDETNIKNKALGEGINERTTSNERKDESNARNTVHQDAERYKESIKESKGNGATVESSNEPIDPLRDSSHDPLKDPSQLFAFVTKTPSPEKGKNLLFSEDDSLFASGTAKREDRPPKKQALDLFCDDREADLFSASLTKPMKKPLKDTKISLFDDDTQDDDDDSLFGPVLKKPSPKPESQKLNPTQGVPKKKNSLFDEDDDDTDLFSEQSEPSQRSDSAGVPEVPKTVAPSNAGEPAKSSNIKDIFGDQSSGEDDIFAAKTIPRKVITSKPLFPSYDDDDDSAHIFGASSAVVESKAKPAENRPSIKKSVTKDLKKTAEKIVEDPLSILQDD